MVDGFDFTLAAQDQMAYPPVTLPAMSGVITVSGYNALNVYNRSASDTSYSLVADGSPSFYTQLFAIMFSLANPVRPADVTLVQAQHFDADAAVVKLIGSDGATFDISDAARAINWL